MSYEAATENSFNAGKKHMDILAKWGVPHQVWDAPKPVDDRCGAHSSLTLEIANERLAPFNMVVSEANAWGAKRWFLTVLDADKPWPSNWCELADTAVSIPADEVLELRGRFGRYKWPPKETLWVGR